MSHKISLTSAILINLNVMVGAGIFINTVLLSQSAGGLGAAAYATVGLLLLPLILSFYQLSKMHRGGNFYDYGLHLGPYAAFITVASYFVAKLASCALAVHVCISLLQTIFPALAARSTLALDCLVITLFALLNMMNMRTGKRIQIFFMVCKFIPILFVFLSGIYLFNPVNFSPQFLYPAGIVSSMPFILYAFSGFEVSCSLSRSIENAERNGPRAMLIAYLLGVSIVCTFQFLFYGNLGPIFDGLKSYLDAYPALLSMLHVHPLLFIVLKGLLHIGIACSALGAAYGIMYSNAWNLFELAHKGHTVVPQLFTWLNSHQIPVACVVVEALVAMSYLLFSKGNQIPLQQILSFGTAISYSLCALSLIMVVYRTNRRKLALPILGFMSCLLLIGAIVRSALLYGILPLFMFVVVMLAMSLMFKQRNADVIEQ